MPDVFISYSRKDQLFVRKLHDALESHDRTTWVDWEGIPLSADWWAEIQVGIEGSDAFIFVISPDSVVSEVSLKEMNCAIGLNKRLIPILRREVQTKAIPPEVSSLNWIFFREEDDFHAAVTTLIETMDTDLAWVKKHTRLTVRAMEWDKNGRNDSFLLRGDDLAAAEQLLIQTGKEPPLTDLQGQYILDSRKSSTRRHRLVIGAITFGFIVALILALIAFMNFKNAQAQEARAWLAVATAEEAKNEADKARTGAVADRNRATTAEAKSYILHDEAQTQKNIANSRELAAAALTVLDSDSELSMLLALQGLDVFHTKEAESVLRQAFHTLQLENSFRYDSPILEMSYSPDSQYLATTNQDGTAKVRAVDSGQIVHTFDAYTAPIINIAYSPANTTLATADLDGAVTIWDAQTGQSLLTLADYDKNSAPNIAYSPDGIWLATAGMEGVLKLWDVDTGNELYTFDSQAPVKALRFNPAGSMILAANSDNIVLGWDISSGNKVLDISTGHSEGVHQLAITPDGKVIATAGMDSVITLWDATSGNTLRELRGHTATIVDIAFSPDGLRLVSVGADSLTKLWDMSNKAKFLFTLPDDGETVQRVAFRPDGVELAVTDAAGTVWFQVMDLELLKTLAQAQTTRRLTPSECQKYLHVDNCP